MTAAEDVSPPEPPLPDACGVGAYSRTRQARANPDTTVFVGNLTEVDPHETDSTVARHDGRRERLLAELFSQFAPVRWVRVPRDRITGVPLGNYAWVEFYSYRDAMYAARITQGLRFRGRPLRTQAPEVPPMDEPQEDAETAAAAASPTGAHSMATSQVEAFTTRKPAPAPGAVPSQHPATASTAIRLRHLPADCTAADIERLCRLHGALAGPPRITQHPARDGRAPEATAAVRFTTPSAAARALRHLHGHRLGRARLSAAWAETTPPSQIPRKRPPRVAR